MKRGLIRSAIAVACVALSSTSAQRASALIPSATDTEPRITITEQPFVITSLTRSRFVIQIPTGVPTRGSLVDVRVHRRIASRTSFQTIANEKAEAAVIDTYSTSLNRLTRTTEGGFVINVPFTSSTNSAQSLTIPFEGVYPISVVVRRDSNPTPLARALTFVHKVDKKSQVPNVVASIAVRLAPTVSTQPNGTLNITDKVRTEVQQFIAFLSSRTSPLTVAVQPEIVSALASSADPQDAALLTQLHTLLRTRTIPTTSFAALDPSLFAAIGRGQEFIEQLRFGETTLNRLLPGVPIQRGTWWATHPLSRDGVNLLRNAGIVSIILSPAAQRGISNERPLGLISRPDGSASQFVSVVSVDAGVAQTLTARDDVTTPYRAIAELITERDDLLAKGFTADSLRLVVSTPSGTLDSSGALERASRLLAGFATTDVSAPLTVDANTTAINFPDNTQHGGDRRGAGISVARTEYTATASMTNDDDPRRILWQSLLTLGESSAVADPNEYIAGLRAQLAATRGAVTVTTPKSITLSGRQGAIRIQLRNNSDQPLSVNVRMASAKLKLSQPIRVVTLAAGSTTELEVEAGTRTNGRFPISVRVTTPSGNLEVVPYITITANVNAIAGFGQLVSISLLLIILAWWWSHWRRARLRAAEPTTVSQQ